MTSPSSVPENKDGGHEFNDSPIASVERPLQCPSELGIPHTWSGLVDPQMHASNGISAHSKARPLISLGMSADGSSTAGNFLTPPTGRYVSPAQPSDWFAIDLPGRAISPSEGLLKRPRVVRAQKIIRIHPLCSASKRTTRLPLPSSAPRARNRQGYHFNPFLLPGYPCRQRCRSHRVTVAMVIRSLMHKPQGNRSNHCHSIKPYQPL
jgi:hypothetical protein